METAIACPVVAGVAFVAAVEVTGTPGPPRFPFVCPRCAAHVTDERVHPGTLTTDELLAFPYLLCGDGDVLLAEPGVRHRAAPPAARTDPVSVPHSPTHSPALAGAGRWSGFTGWLRPIRESLFAPAPV